MPVFRFRNEVHHIAKDVKAFLHGRSRQRRALKRKERELSWIDRERGAANERTEVIEHRRKRKRVEQEIFRLETELRAHEGGQEADKPAEGALPDFVIIGGKKCGTTFLYNLLSLHPHVAPASSKELHYFDDIFDEENLEWYRRCFPEPRWENGRRTIAGEATPVYLSHPRVPERMAQVVPQARLIALLRNPVDRAYSDYQQAARKNRELRTFEAAIRDRKVRPSGREGKIPEREDHAGLNEGSRYLSRGVYVDQLLRWSRFFADEQVLVLKSEDLFESPRGALELVLHFLDLPDWEPKAWKKIPRKRNRGKSYEREMDPATRRRLEGFFEPHNRRLYEYLGVDFGW